MIGYFLTIFVIVLVFIFIYWRYKSSNVSSAATTLGTAARSVSMFCITNMSTLLYLLFFGILGAGALAVVALLGYGVFMVIENKRQINKQWATYKCKPYIMPFAGWLIGPPGTSPTTNFVDCMFGLHKTFFGVLMDDYNVMMTAIVDIVTGHTNALQDIRGMFAYMRESIQDSIMAVYNKLYNAFKRVEWFFGLFKQSFGQLMQVMSDVFSIMTYTYDTFGSIWNGPIGGIAKFFCFAPDTPIDMFDGPKAIAAIRVGDITDSGAIVTDTFVLSAEGVEMYGHACGAVVSGDHIVLGDGAWCLVKNAKGAEHISYTCATIHCINTTDGAVSVAGTIFKDYKETGDVLTANYQTDSLREIKQKLRVINNSLFRSRDLRYYAGRSQCKLISNESITSESSSSTLMRSDTSLNATGPMPMLTQTQMPTYTVPPIYYGAGLMLDTLVAFENGTYKQIRDVAIGDRLYKSSIVVGIVESSSVGVKLYTYADLVMSGTDIVLDEDQMWNPAMFKGIPAPPISELLPLRHLITSSGIIPLRSQSVGNVYVRDHTIVRNAELDANLLAERMKYLNMYLE